MLADRDLVGGSRPPSVAEIGSPITRITKNTEVTSTYTMGITSSSRVIRKVRIDPAAGSVETAMTDQAARWAPDVVERDRVVITVALDLRIVTPPGLYRLGPNVTAAGTSDSDRHSLTWSW